ncbi:MAG TPA: MASE1 domain-containing protein [Acidimicrobiia bacterium]|nr:MASE1 domain-containing protein [Acidimicrobiia bacterium]
MRELRMLVTAAVLGGLYALGAVLTYHFLSAPGAGASFFPPAGITLATLLVTPRRTWWLWLLAFGIAEFTLDLTHNQTLFMAIGFTAANVIEPLVGASLIRFYSQTRRATPRVFLVRYVLCAVVAGPFVGALIGGSVATIAGASGFFRTTAEWWLGDALGVLVVATPVLAWTRRDFYRTPATLAEDLAIAAFATFVAVVPAIFFHESSAYAVLPILMWAAIRGGPLGVAISGLGVGIGASVVVANGHAYTLITTHGAEVALVDIQLFIAVTLLAALTLAVEVAERARAEQILRLTETDLIRSELAGLQAAETERRRIARETHDIVGHALNVIILSGAAARRVFDRDPAQAKQLLATVEDVGRDAFRDLDVALGLTDQSPDFASPKGLGDLDELIDRLVQAGMHLEYDVEGSLRPLPRLVDGSAYRIIQESLTNVARYAVEANTRVQVRYEPEALHLEIVDDGSRNGRSRGGNGGGHNGNGNGNGSGNDNGNGGRGLIGMRERVAVLGGRLEAGPDAHGGFAVVAELPLEPV